MKLISENPEEFGEEEYAKKHAPVIEGKIVKIGTIKHPITKEHFIEWIEAESEKGEISKIFLTPTNKPQAEFSFNPIKARMYCNIHGLWKIK